ncbi:MAG: TonB-dependent receptor plug domain-containing protein [Gammaproteobacteria bacterium]|nr:TonB-dependent receptor plug domain-containing protein [Gammaproteobacteria bacterium]
MSTLKSSSILAACLLLAPPLSIFAQQPEPESDADSDEGEAVVVPIDVEAPELRVQQGRSEYNADFIETMPTGQGDLADLLRMNPAVEFSRSADLSAGAGTLRPAEISIHGQLFYQNLFLIDGADTTSDIDPAVSPALLRLSPTGDLFSVPSLFQPIGGSSPQGYYLDVELLEKVEVYDSNIPVEYGGFTGGVVAAAIKSYQGEDTFSWHFGMQRDEWEEFHIAEDDITANDRYNGVYTPDYQKSNFGISLRQGLGGDLGLTLGLTRRQSRFAQEYEDDTDTLRMLEYEDHIDNLMGRLDTRLGDTDTGLSFRYSTRRHDGITSDTYTGGFEKEHEGYGLTLDLGRPLGAGLLDLKLSFDQLSDSLDSEYSFFTFHEYLEGSGESRYEGAYGDVEQRQTRIALKPKWSLDPISLAGREHTFTVGGDYRNTRSHYERPEDVVFERYDCIRDMGREGCQDQDGSGGSSAGDEILGLRAFYYAGKANLAYNEWAAYAEDRIDLGAWQINLGARGDWDSYLENFNVSPRFSFAWSPFEDGSGELTAGASRYYGRSFFRYQLNDAIYGWRETYQNLSRPRGRAGEEVPCSDPDFVNCRRLLFENRSGASELETPYSDEISLGWRQRVGAFEGKLQLLTRESRKGVSRRREDDGLYYYNNEGRSSTRSATLELTNSTPLTLGLTETRFTMGLGYRDTESNRYDNESYDDALETDLIYYRGSLIPPEALPAWDYNVPLGFRLNSVTEIPKWGLTWSNFYIIRRGGTVARDSGENYQNPETGAAYDVYEDYEFSSLFTINSRVQWSRALTSRSEAYLRFEIHNLLDRVVDTETRRNSMRRRNTQGRRFWVEAGMRYF